MKKNKKSKIPNFATLEEEAKFWDTHSVTDFEDETEEVELIVDLQQPVEDTLVLRVAKSFKKQLADVARKKGISVSKLGRMWLMEKLRSHQSVGSPPA